MATGNLTVTPLPQTAKNAKNTVDVTEANGNIQVTINGTVDLNQPTVADVDSVIIYGSTANDRLTVDPSVTVPVTLSSGTGGKHVLTAGGGPTQEQGWYGTTVEKQGSSTNALFGKAGKVTFVKGSGTTTSRSPGRPTRPKATRGFAGSRRVPKGTFFTFSGNKLVKTSNPFTASTASTTTTASSTTKTTEAKTTAAKTTTEKK